MRVRMGRELKVCPAVAMHPARVVWMTALAVLVLGGCGGSGPDPSGGIEQAADAVGLPNPMCTVGSLDPGETGEELDGAVLAQLAPTGVLRVGVNYGNLNNAALDPTTK